MRIEWSDAAIASARRFIRDQEGLAILALADDPYPAEAFHAGAYHRLRVDSHRVVYFIDGQVITIDRVDRVT